MADYNDSGDTYDEMSKSRLKNLNNMNKLVLKLRKKAMVNVETQTETEMQAANAGFRSMDGGSMNKTQMTNRSGDVLEQGDLDLETNQNLKD